MSNKYFKQMRNDQSVSQLNVSGTVYTDDILSARARASDFVTGCIVHIPPGTTYKETTVKCNLNGTSPVEFKGGFNGDCILAGVVATGVTLGTISLGLTPGGTEILNGVDIPTYASNSNNPFGHTQSVIKVGSDTSFFADSDSDDDKGEIVFKFIYY